MHQWAVRLTDGEEEGAEEPEEPQEKANMADPHESVPSTQDVLWEQDWRRHIVSFHAGYVGDGLGLGYRGRGVVVGFVGGGCWALNFGPWAGGPWTLDIGGWPVVGCG